MKRPKRPWRIEYMNAESEWVIQPGRTYHLKLGARLALPRIEKENPGVVFRIVKHVEFEAKG